MSAEPGDIVRAIAVLADEIAALRRQLEDQRIFLEIRNRGQLAAPDDYRDGPVRAIPPRWTGERIAPGTLMSRCPPDLLEMYAGALAERAMEERNKRTIFAGRSRSFWLLQDAARARRWAYRLRTEGPERYRDIDAPRDTALGNGATRVNVVMGPAVEGEDEAMSDDSDAMREADVLVDAMGTGSTYAANGEVEATDGTSSPDDAEGW